MDVTTENFASVLEQLRHQIPTCEFIGIDCEFTGLEDACSTPGSASVDNSIAVDFEEGHDEAQHRYEKLRSAAGFLVVQVGICLFDYNANTKAFVARPYNFYTFPANFRGEDRRFLCQTRCMHFLAQQGFNFNKLLSSGIPFLGHHQELSIRQSAPELGDFLKDIRSRVARFLANSSQASFVLPPTDAYHRKLTFTELATVFKDIVKVDKTMVQDKLCIQVHRAQGARELGSGLEEIADAIEARARKAEEAELQEAIGFRHVMDLVSRFNKPIVGHNMLMDLVQLEAHFGNDLPESLPDFRAQVAAKFPLIFDTKHMIASAPAPLARHFNAGSRLDCVYRVLCGDSFRHPKIELHEGFERYGDTAAHHEAGYDAYITGAAFLRLAQFMVMSMDIPQRKHSSGLTPRLRQMGGSLPPGPVLLEGMQNLGFHNKVFLMGGKKLKFIRLGAVPEESDGDEDDEDEGAPIELEAAGSHNGAARGGADGGRWSYGGENVHHGQWRGRGRGRGGGGHVHATPPRVNRQRMREDGGSGKKREEKRPRVSV